jgi:hypothetical protein
MHGAGVNHGCLSQRVKCVCRNKTFLLVLDDRIEKQLQSMKNYAKILFSLLAAIICTAAFAADKPNCKKTGKNCPMNDKKECNCGKDCGCDKM